MTIRRGENWGEVQPLPPDIPTLIGNRALFDYINDETTDFTRPILIAGSDLAKTCGGTNDAHPRDRAQISRPAHTARESYTLLPLDLGLVTTPGGGWRFASHCVIATAAPRLPPRPWHRWWRSEVSVIMNAQFHGTLDLAPRSHPNDGRLDASTFTAAMNPRQRWTAWHRMPLGTHVPHPHITQQRLTSATAFTFSTPRTITLDGVSIGTHAEMTVDVVADAFTAFV